MDEQNKNSKYIIWLYGISGREYAILQSRFPSDLFEVVDLFQDDKIYEISKLNLLDRPDVIICDVGTNVNQKLRDELCDSRCTLSMVSTRPFPAFVGNSYELTDELVNVRTKNGYKQVTKTDIAVDCIIDACQMSNIEKLQKIVAENTKNLRATIDYDKEMHSGKTITNITTKYLFKLAKILNNYITFKDHYTSGHCQRVSMYSEALGMALGLSNEKLEELILAANLHDIGKIALPDAVITKPSRLNDLEFNLMKRHVELGTSILPTDQFSNIKSSVRAHHEKYDGSGYPDGLKGNDIPYFAQILAIADGFDAMTSQRSYNKVKSAQEAFEDLLQHTKPYGEDGGLGVHYNPELVKAFIKVVSSSKTIMDGLEEQKKIADQNYENALLKQNANYQYVKGGNSND